MTSLKLTRRDFVLLSGNVATLAFAGGPLGLARPAFAQSLPVMNQAIWTSIIYPPTYSQATGDWQKAFAGKAKINFLGINSAPELVTGMAGGNYDVGWVGVQGIVTAWASGVAVSVVSVDINRDMDALVARRDSGIKTIKDLKGKRVATSLNSSSHLALLWSLKLAGMDVRDFTLINMRPDQVGAAWARRDVDAAYIFGPFMLNVVADDGFVVTNVGNLVDAAGQLIYVGTIVRDDFKRKHPELVVAYLKEYYRTAQLFKTQKETVVKKVMEHFKVKEDIALLNISGRVYLPPAEQLKDEYMGPPGAKDSGVLRGSKLVAEFMLEQRQINSIPPSFANFIDSSFIAQIA